MTDDKEILKEEIFNSLSRAKFLLYKTYPLLKEQRLFLEVLRNIDELLQNIEELILYELQRNNLISKEEFILAKKSKKDKKELFLTNKNQLKELFTDKFKLNEFLETKFTLESLLLAQKEGPADFTYKEDYIVCENNYKVQVISYNFTQNFVDLAEKFCGLIKG